MISDPSEAATVWMGEWKLNGQRVLFDPVAQTEPGTATFFNVTTGKAQPVLRHRVEGAIRRLDSGRDLEAAVEVYRLWQAEQAAKAPANRPSSGTRKGEKARRPRVSDSYANDDLIRLDDAVFAQDWEMFVSLFPGGFEDPAFEADERDYKLKGGERILELLSEEAFATHDEDEMITRLIRAAGATDNLLYSTEHAAFQGGLRVAGPHRAQVLSACRDLLWGSGDADARFTAWAHAVESLPATGSTPAFKWPVVTAIPFLADPASHCILKPAKSQSTAARYRINLRYEPQPNLAIYRRWLAIVDALGERLREHGARDRVDVQSFIWRVFLQRRERIGEPLSGAE